MKKIGEVLQQSIGKKEERVMPALSPEAKSLVDLLFVALEEHVKYFRLNHLSGNDQAKREWTKTFMECGMSKQRVQKGIKRMRSSGEIYATITPGEFLTLCAIAPEDIGSPDIGAAYLEACKNSHPCETNKKWSHKAIRYATHKTGSHFLRTEPKSVSYSVFEKNYLEACQMFFDGKILDQIESDSPMLRVELERVKEVIAEDYLHLNSHRKALDAIRDILA